MQEVAQHRGIKDQTYDQALKHIHDQSRENGIDAAMLYTYDKGNEAKYDALLLADRKGGGQQLAAQAGYPIITIPVGLDDTGFPLGLSIQHTAWNEAVLVKWASAIEALLRDKIGPRPTPKFRNYGEKNIPVNRP